MKKILLLLACANFAHLTLLAQKTSTDKPRPRVAFGVKFGGTAARLYDGTLLTAATKSGAELRNEAAKLLINPTAGIFLTFHINNHWAFTPELVLAVGGSADKYQLRYQTTSQDVTSLTELNYLQIPLLATYTLGKVENKVRPFVNLGITPAYLLRGTIKQDVSTTQNSNGAQLSTDSNTNNFTAEKTTKRYDGAGTLGIGLHLGKAIDLETRYNLGFLSLSSDPTLLINNAKNQVLSLSIGAKF